MAPILVLVIMVVVIVVMVIVVSTMLLMIVRYILIVVQSVLYEVNRLATGVVSVAMFAPIFRMSGRHMQVKRRQQYTSGRLNYHWFQIDQRGPREIADVYVTVKAGLTNTD